MRLYRAGGGNKKCDSPNGQRPVNRIPKNRNMDQKNNSLVIPQVFITIVVGLTCLVFSLGFLIKITLRTQNSDTEITQEESVQTDSIAQETTVPQVPSRNSIGGDHPSIKSPSLAVPDSGSQTGGLSPLHLAAAQNNCVKIADLLNEGANIEETDSYHMTPLHLAARDNAVEAIYVLIKAGANIEAKSNAGQTPLHIAAFAI